MTRDDAFLQAIIERPDDDAPRLVYADRLEEHGERDRAEFIRVQCALAAARPLDGSRYEDLRLREKALWWRYGRQWVEPLQQWAGGVGFHRGFAENVIVRDGADDPLHPVRQLLRAAPVRYLELDGWLNSADISLLAPAMTRLRGFMLVNMFDIDEEALLRLLTSAHLAGLEVLAVDSNHNGCGLSQEVSRSVVASPHWTRLSVLKLEEGRHNETVVALAGSPAMARLTHLDLAEAEMRPEGAKALAESPHLRRLLELNLGECVIGPDSRAMRVEDWMPLVNSPNLSNLRWLGWARYYKDDRIEGLWKERFPPTVLDLARGPVKPEYSSPHGGFRAAVPWLFHRWNQFFPHDYDSEFLAADCRSTDE